MKPEFLLNNITATQVDMYERKNKTFRGCNLSSIMGQRIGKSVFMLLMLLTSMPLSAQTLKKTYFLVDPFATIMGVDMRVERQLGYKTSVEMGVNAHLWNLFLVGEKTEHQRIPPPKIAITPAFKWYFNEVGYGFYLKGKLTAGYFLQEPAIANHPYYVGGGFYGGCVTPLFHSERVSFFGEIGLQFVPPFGSKAGADPDRDNNVGMVYYSTFSPASLIDISLGLSIRL